VDVELVGLDDSGRPDFNLLQNFRDQAARIHYWAVPWPGGRLGQVRS
jgi:hypothetical protein